MANRRLRGRPTTTMAGTTLFCTFWGRNILFHNNADGTFTDVTRKPGFIRRKAAGGTGCTFLDYDRDGTSRSLRLQLCRPRSGPSALNGPMPLSASGRGVPTMCGPRGFARRHQHPLSQQRRRNLQRCLRQGGILAPGPRYSITSVSYDFSTTTDGRTFMLPSIPCPASSFRNNHDGTFTDVAVQARAAPTTPTDTSRPAWESVLADYDCDGWLDIFKTNFAGRHLRPLFTTTAIGTLHRPLVRTPASAAYNN